MPPNAECDIMGRMKPPSVLVMMEPVSLPRLEGIARYAREHHWNLMLDDRLAGGISDWRGDGVIATLRRRSSRLAAVRKLTRAGIPVVDLTIECLRLRLPRVISDHTAIGRLGGEHFKARGFENVVWFSSGWSEVHRRRYQGFSDIFAKKVPRIGLRNLRRRLKECEKPVGVFAYNDTDAAQVIVGDEEEGMEPRDDIGFALPKEGFTIAFDEMVVAKDSRRKDLAYAFINYIYSGEVAAVNMDYLCGPNPVKPGIDLLEEDYRNLIVLSPDKLSNGQVLKGFDDPAVNELYNKAWDKIKATEAKLK